MFGDVERPNRYHDLVSFLGSVKKPYIVQLQCESKNTGCHALGPGHSGSLESSCLEGFCTDLLFKSRFPVVFDLCAEQTLWNTARDTELKRPLTQAEERRRKSGIPQEQIAQDRLWNKRPDGVAFKMTTKTKTGVICLLEFKRMSDVTSHYIVRGKHEPEAQYSSLRSALAMTMNRQDWEVEQVSFVAGARSLNEEELKKNLTFSRFPPQGSSPSAWN